MVFGDRFNSIERWNLLKNCMVLQKKWSLTAVVLKQVLLHGYGQDKKFGIMTTAYLEIQDDGPNQAKDYGRLSIHNIRGIDIHQLDLKTKYHCVTNCNKLSSILR